MADVIITLQNQSEVDSKSIQKVIHSKVNQSLSIMSEVELKQQEPTISEIKAYIHTYYPQQSQALEQLSENQVKRKYQEIIRHTQYDENISLEEDIFDIEKDVLDMEDKSCKIENFEDAKTKNMPSNKRQSHPDPEVIREQLIKNLPEMRQQIKAFQANQLNQLYNQFCQSTQSASNNNPEMLEMMTVILDRYPTMRDKIVSLTEAEIFKLYDSINLNSRVKRKTPSTTMKDIESVTSRGRPDQQKKQPKARSPFQNRDIDQLTNFEGQLISGKEKKSPRTKNTVFNDSKQSSFKGNHLRESQFSSAYNSNGYDPNANNANGQFWNMDHFDSSKGVRARTYVMVHTEYEGQPRKQVKGDLSFDKCACYCCKNNTVQNMFKQIISRIEASRH